MILHNENVKQVFLYENTQNCTLMILKCIEDLKTEVYA